MTKADYLFMLSDSCLPVFYIGVILAYMSSLEP